MVKKRIAFIAGIAGFLLISNVALAADTVLPTVSMANPIDGANYTIGQTVFLSAIASDDAGVAKVEFYDNGVLINKAFFGSTYWLIWGINYTKNGNHSITAKAYDAAGNMAVSNPINIAVNIPATSDNTPPKIYFSYPKEGELVTDYYKPSVSASDNLGVVNVDFYVDDIYDATTVGPWSYGTFFSDFETGKHIFTAKAYDAAGNVGVATTSFLIDNSRSLPLDVYPPVASIVAPVNGATVSGNVNIKTAVSDKYGSIFNVMFIIGGIVKAYDYSVPYDYIWDTTAVPNGNYTVQIRAMDTGRNISSSDKITINVNNLNNFSGDNKIPDTNITFPLTGTEFNYSQETIIKSDARDNVGVSKVEFYDGNKLIGTDISYPYEISWSVVKEDNGVHVFTSKAYDTSGNAGNISPAVFAMVDIHSEFEDVTKPRIGIIRPETNLTYTSNKSVIIDLAADDNIGISKIELYDGDILKQSISGSGSRFLWSITNADNGIHNLTVKAYDVAGNVNTSNLVMLTVNITTVDTTAPTVSLTAPAIGMNYTTAQTVAIDATASDNKGVTKVEFYVDGTLKGTDTSSPYSYSWAITAANNGAHSLTARAYDAAGLNKTSTAVSVTINIPVPDTTAPTVSLTAPAIGMNYTTAQTVAIDATASDNKGVTKVEFYDGATLLGTDTATPYTFSWAITAANNGTHSLTAKAYDAAGNDKISNPVNLTINIGTGTPVSTAPIVNFSRATPVDGSVIAGDVVLSIKATDDKGLARMEWYTDGGLQTIVTISNLPISFNLGHYLEISDLAVGSHTFTVKVYDTDNNVTEKSVTYTIL